MRAVSKPKLPRGGYRKNWDMVHEDKSSYKRKKYRHEEEDDDAPEKPPRKRKRRVEENPFDSLDE